MHSEVVKLSTGKIDNFMLLTGLKLGAIGEYTIN